MGREDMILDVLKEMRDEIDKKTSEYREYIQKHISLVQKAYTEYILPIQDSSDSELMEAIQKAGSNIVHHDASKYSKEEFNAYRFAYYPTSFELKEKDYDEHKERVIQPAWKHHYMHNEHHPLYWYNDDRKEDMPLEYIIEMLCDWIAMGMYFNSSTYSWYENQAIGEKSHMTEYTKGIVEEILYNRIKGLK